MSDGLEKPIPPAPGSILGGKYKFIRHIGGGNFGSIHLGENAVGEYFAIKTEDNTRCKLLEHEYRIYRYLHRNRATEPVVGVPVSRWFSQELRVNALVLDLMGPSLEACFKECGGRFSLKTVLMLADQLICRMEFLHSNHMLHRDIKPENFLMGRHPHDRGIVHVVDFGLSKKYRDSTTKQHIPLVFGKSLTGTARYASINTHQGLEQGRRDDLESIGYMLIYFLVGKLPWQGLVLSPAEGPDPTSAKHFAKIKNTKIATSMETLCAGIPAEFGTFIMYCRALGFDEQPDYSTARKLFRLVHERFEFQDDGIFDWEIKEEDRRRNSGRAAQSETATPTSSVKKLRPSRVQNDLEVPTSESRTPSSQPASLMVQVGVGPNDSVATGPVRADEQLPCSPVQSVMTRRLGPNGLVTASPMMQNKTLDFSMSDDNRRLGGAAQSGYSPLRAPRLLSSPSPAPQLGLGGSMRSSTRGLGGRGNLSPVAVNGGFHVEPLGDDVNRAASAAVASSGVNKSAYTAATRARDCPLWQPKVFAVLAQFLTEKQLRGSISRLCSQAFLAASNEIVHTRRLRVSPQFTSLLAYFNSRPPVAPPAYQPQAENFNARLLSASGAVASDDAPVSGFVRPLVNPAGKPRVENNQALAAGIRALAIGSTPLDQFH